MVKRKRSNAAGAIYYSESDGRWEASLVVGYKQHPTRVDAEGRPLRLPVRKKFTGRTQKVVAQRLAEAQAALEQGLAVPDHRTSIEDFARWWLAEVLPGEGLSPATERFYREVLTYWVVPIVGTKTLTGPRALTAGDVEAMTARLDREGRSTRVQVAARTTLGKVLRAAEQRGLVARNVARLARPPRDRGKARSVKALTAEQVAALVAAASGSRWGPLIVVATATGLRPGELLALHWGDLHLDGPHPHLSVRHALSHVAGAALKAPKRDRSYRTVPLPPEAVTALRAWRKAQAAERLIAGPLWSPDWPGLVFSTEDGKPVRGDVFRHAVRRLVAAANASRPDGTEPLPHVHPHMLRHTYATHLIEAGVPIAHVAELLGDTVAVVESTYSHVLRPKHEVASVVSRLFEG